MKKTLKILLPAIILLFALYSCLPNETNIAPTEKVDFNCGWFFCLGDTTPQSHILFGLPSLDQHVDDVFDNEGWRYINLPHDWSIEGDFALENPATPGGGALPGGIGWYRKKFKIDIDTYLKKHFFIEFDGVYCNSTVWINGHLLGSRPNGYVPFRYELQPYLFFGDEQNEILVKVDNSKQPNSRWYSGSGIYRNVRLVKANRIQVDMSGIYVTTPKISKRKATINVQTTIKRNWNDYTPTFKVRQTLYDAQGKEVAHTKSREISYSSIQRDGYIEPVEQVLRVRKPVLWSVDNPYLYKLKTEVFEFEQVVDVQTTKVGIRSFEFDAQKGFILNGEHVKINGVCNHHDLGCLGAAVNKRAIRRQLEILKAMGCNGIRCSHNPPAPELLDLCDEMGFIVMDEAFDMWMKQKTTYDYSHYFAKWYERDISDLVRRDRNHPSVFMWSIGNEVGEQWGSDDDVNELTLQEANIALNESKKMSVTDSAAGTPFSQLLTQRLADIVKKLDPTRPITAGCNNTDPSNHLFKSGALDIIGFNYHAQDFEKVRDQLPAKPFIVSESVSGLMSRGFYMTPSDSMFIWPERWDKHFDRPLHQCSSYDNCHVPWGDSHEENWKYIKKNDFIAGQYIWTGFDYLGEPTPFWWQSRSSYFGIIDLAGFPKDVYYMYQSEWTNKNVLHIFPHWNWKVGDVIDVWAYYNNADRVELFLNDKSLGVKSKQNDDLHVSWQVPFEPGVLKAVSQKENGTVVMTKEIVTAGEPVAIRLTADRDTLDADRYDLSFITAEVVDKDGNVVPTADNLIKFNVEGNITLEGTDNGNPTDINSLKKPERQLFNGKCLVVVKNMGYGVSATINATSEGLEAAKVILTMK